MNDSIENLIKSNSKKISKTEILCVGDMILDQYIYGKVERMSPEAPVPILSIKEENFQLDRLSKMALDDPSTSGNPKKLSEADMKIMYQHSMSGKLF